MRVDPGIDEALGVIDEKRKVFPACFGPNVVGRYDVIRSLLARGLFDMMRVRTKLDEQRSERILGLFLARDPATLDTGSLGGDYLRAERPRPRHVAELPFRKVHGYHARSQERWHE